VNFRPEEDKHESTIYFEPISGTPIRAQLRIQLSTSAWIDRLKINPDGSTDPVGTRAIRRFIPMMWIDQTIILNNETQNRLHRVSGILDKGQYVYQSLRLLYVIIAFLSVFGILIVLELVCYVRRVRYQLKMMFE